ncbi:MAG: flagellar biosynthetic protein FliR [Labilithrix sp.]|nr:flagellar biosynthetic protein FliR [Labilithrix sp.]MBX3210420.1 flagellar biosynthetic protein FliR [Labilithrix sp.]
MTSLPAFALAEAAAFVLAAARVAGFVVTSPFPGRNVPNQAKIGLVLMLAWIARAASPATPSLGLDLALLGVVPGELGIGIVIGFTVRVTFSAAEMLGASFAQATGLTFGQVYDPTLGGEDSVPSRVVTLFSMLLFLGLGAHRVALAYALESFRVLPLGHAVEIGAAAPSMVDFLGQAMDAGVRLSVPVMAIALAVQMTLALVARASPSLQVFSVGMGVTVAAGLLAILGTIDDAAVGLAAELEREGPRIEEVVTDVAAR